MITGVAVVTVVVAPTKALQSQDVTSLRKFQQTPGKYPGPQPPIYEGNPFIFLFWGTWGMFQGFISYNKCSWNDMVGDMQQAGGINTPNTSGENKHVNLKKTIEN